MANLVLFAKAHKLGIPNFRQLSEADLKTAIAQAEKGAKSTPAKGKTTTAAKGKTAAASKGKTATPAKGKTTPAKGKTTAAKPTKPVKASPAKSTARKSSPAKGKGAQGVQAKRTPARGRSKQPVGAVALDNKAIDWKAESNVGQSGKRKEVLDSLRKFKGDKSKVFAALQGSAKKFYPSKTKHDAERTLVWLIGRVAYDFAFKSGQHTPGQRAEYGTSEASQDIRRRELREAARKAEAKALRARRGAPSRKSAAGRKTTAARKSTATRKSTASRAKGKTTAARKR